MRLRHERKQPTDLDEEALERSVRELAGDEVEQSPLPAFWSRQIVDINKRIDEATSGVAISVSWAARVAIPGVVAVLAFLIGLKYYAPEGPGTESLRQATAALAPATVESLYVASAMVPDTAVVREIDSKLLAVNSTRAEDFYVENAAAGTLVEDLSDQEVREVLAALSTGEK
jgi:hypothetical protein